MHVSMKELGRWVDLSNVEDPDELAHRLTMAGLEVEGVVHFGRGLDDIVVGKIDAIEEHEKADKLVICRVDVGDGRQRQIVCGATNMKAGDRVPVALPGSQPPAIDFEIGERKVLGVMSEGMLCAAEELGLADESEGLMILPESLELGQPVFAALGLIDTHFEIGLTPNRPDCLSHLGVAREVAALYDAKFDRSALHVSPAWDSPHGDVGEVASLEVHDTDGCPRYIAAVIEGVEVGPSPVWLQRMVTAMGMRSINNVVDVTNAVLADIGQPLHAFDLDKLEGNSIVVRRAEEGEKILGIDHKEYDLDSSDLVIADASRPVAIAGVMGGADSEVTEETTRVLLECAYFDPTTVRKTSKRLGIHTESSHRFERGIDPGATLRNITYAIKVLLDTQGQATAVRNGVLEEYPEPIAHHTIDLPDSLVPRILGVDIPTDRVGELLQSIGVEVDRHDDAWHATIPTFRPDLERPIDLVEEVARLWGYDNFEATLPQTAMGADHEMREDSRHPETLVSGRTLRDTQATRARLLAAGFHEGLNYSFMSGEEFDLLGLDEHDRRRTAAARVSNPLTKEQEFMRTSLVPGLLRALQTNLSQRQSDIALFEMGRRFFADEEVSTLAIIATGQTRRHFSERRNWDFYDIKGVVESLVGAAEHTSTWARPTAPEPYLHPGVQAEWAVDGEPMGIVGQLHPALVQSLDLDLDAPVLLAEVRLGALLELEADDSEFRPFPKFPAVTRDFALVYDQAKPYQEIDDAIRSLAESDDDFGALLESVELFDVYEGEQVPDGKRSLALAVVYRAADRTLTEDEIGSADRRLLEAVAQGTGAELR